MISSNNLDKGINAHFQGSEDEVAYSDLRLQPLLFQDNLGRLSTSRDSAQAGNIKIEACFDTKLLDANTDKTVYILIGDKKNNLKNQIDQNPLTS